MAADLECSSHIDTSLALYREARHLKWDITYTTASLQLNDTTTPRHSASRNCEGFRAFMAKPRAFFTSAPGPMGDELFDKQHNWKPLVVQ